VEGEDKALDAFKLLMESPSPVIKIDVDQLTERAERLARVLGPEKLRQSFEGAELLEASDHWEWYMPPGADPQDYEQDPDLSKPWRFYGPWRDPSRN